ncbi:anthranilate synthase/aminodeoxychorismate synthase-like glutamine amidotransferase [Alkalibacillus flavidus]|uniref:Anthranilate synthase/aminodeoxychorismate synthase-like glutamine amidotransferase n=1 Tax=Alkalibacillus flavidus TaxID=546021 RepID=A0ABV2KY63_9BACI
MILLIDHYDSFTYNLFQYLEELGASVTVKRHDDVDISSIKNMQPDAIVLSPGPGKPNDYPDSIETVKTFYEEIPILGICLGHQIIAEAFGAQVQKAGEVRHGKKSLILHKGNGLFEYLSQPLNVMRYHSLVVNEQTLPPFFKRKAITMDDGELMAIEHDNHPLFGIQFHPESIGTTEGKQILNRFLQRIGKENHDERITTIS